MITVSDDSLGQKCVEEVLERVCGGNEWTGIVQGTQEAGKHVVEGHLADIGAVPEEILASGYVWV